MAKKEITVLLIEDDPVAAGLFEAQIASDFTTRFETVMADTFAKALDQIGRRVFDVAALDLNLPDARGLEALDRLRRAAEDLPIVVLTGLDDEQMAVEALQHGAQDYLVKGDLTGRLISRSLRYAIERQRLTEALKAVSLLDEPTGLFNRRGLMILAEQQLKTARRFRRGIGLIEIEIGAPDTKLVDPERRAAEVAKTLRETFRGSDLISRFGERTFVVLAIEPDREGMETALERLRQRLERPDGPVTARLRWTDTEDLTEVGAMIAELDASGSGPTPFPSPNTRGAGSRPS